MNENEPSSLETPTGVPVDDEKPQDWTESSGVKMTIGVLVLLVLYVGVRVAQHSERAAKDVDVSQPAVTDKNAETAPNSTVPKNIKPANVGMGIPMPPATVDVSDLDYDKLLNDPQFHLLLGLAYGRANNPLMAVAHQNEVLRIEPKNIAALNNLGHFLYEGKQYEASARALMEACKLDPKMDLARNNLLRTCRAGLKAAKDEKSRAQWQARLDKLSAPNVAK